tara:strand:+ start:321 stop:1145 length:825 start_codon:yes stop_codon:yes gene_type:complete
MAVNLVNAGFRTQLHNRSRVAEEGSDLAAAHRCASPAEAANDVDVLLVCVSDDAAVEAVLFGAGGASDSLRSGCVVLDCSTISPAQAIHCAGRLARQGVTYLDAPVTGGTEGAKAGSLTVLVGGEASALQQVQPVLEVIGGTVHHFGAVGRGQQVKAVNQVLVAGSYAAVAEAMALGQRLELPMQQVVEALKGGAAGSWALNHRAEGMLAGQYPLGFKLALHHKDLGIALSSAESVQLELPISRLVQQQEADLMGRGHGDEDVSALHRQFSTIS